MKLKRIIKISRPRFWIYEIGPYIVGIVAAASSVYSIWLTPAIIIFFVFFAYPANIYIYGINDIYDYETDKLNPKKVSYESLVHPSEHKSLFRHIALVTAPFLLYAIFNLSIESLIALCLFFFFAGFYSATPIRAKARPILDSFFSAGHYVATGIFSYLLVMKLLDNSISWFALSICTVASMAWAISMHAYSAVPDIQADKDAHLETIATKLGKSKTIYVCAFLYAISAILTYPYLGIVSIFLGLVYLYFMYLSLKANDERLFKIYTYFPKINTLSGMIVFFTILFS
jgi:4-hydroxybenzoate polyprenyltransferase